MRNLLFAVAGLSFALSAHAAEIRFDFNATPPGALPTNFVPLLIGGGAPGDWKVVMADVSSTFAVFSNEAPALNRIGVLAQTGQDLADEHFPMLLYTGEKFRNFKFTTRFKIGGGVAEQMAGLVFRYQNSSNYYVVRASALGKNIRFYKVVDGRRSDPIGPDMEIAPGTWHTLAVQCDGTQIGVFFDGQPAMPVLGDSSFNEGLIGFRTKSDTVAYFTGAAVDYTPIVPGAQAIVNTVTAKQPRLLGLTVYTLQGTNATRAIASKDAAEIGRPGTDDELAALLTGKVFYGKSHGVDIVVMPLHDRNGEFIAAVRLRLKSFFGETQDNAVARARNIIKLMQEQVGEATDLE